MDSIQRFAMAAPSALVQRAMVATSPEPLHTFVRLAWPVIEPGRAFVDGMPVHAICCALEMVTRGQIKRLVINCPPGFMKSLLVNVFWPVWEWSFKPETRWIYASYDPSLSLRDARKAHTLITSRWFVERWGSILAGGRQPYSDYYSRARGNRFSTSIKGKATGRHFDRHVVDDPTKPRDALGGASLSEAALNDAIQWYDQTLSSRTSDPENTSRVIIMQRLHERDLAGYVLAKGGYHHLCIPMRYDRMIARCDWRTINGELAWPERFPETAAQILEKDLSTAAAISAQLQQSPSPTGGHIFKEQDIRFWHTDLSVRDRNGRPCIALPNPLAGAWFQSWDLTFKDAEASDYVCGGALQGVGNDVFLHDARWEQMSFTQGCNALGKMTRDWPRTLRKLIEDKANGPATEDLLKKVVPGIVLVNPEGGKASRAQACTTFIEKGNLILPHESIAPWVNEAIKQLTKFPFVAHDDFVDMITQALIDYFLRRNKLTDAMKALATQLGT